jgi:hypothetical protein
VSNDEYGAIDNSETTFGNKLFSSRTTSTKNYYSIGNPLYALITDNSKSMKAFFPLPKPNLSGLCDYYRPALFMKNEETECSATLVMDSATCTGPKFNAKYFKSDIIKLLDNPASTTSTISITTTGTHFKIDNAGAITTVTDTVPDSTFAGTICTDHVEQVHYTFKYNDRGDGFLVPKSVNAIFVLKTTDSSSAIPIKQKFFTFFELEGSTDVYYKSGNPGYLNMMKLFAGSLNTNNQIEMNKDGFRMPIDASTCGTSNTGYSTNTDNVLRFNQNMTVSCYMEATANTEAAFQTLCGTDISSFTIFSQLNSLTRIGRYGNADVNYPKDWITVLDVDMTLAAGTYDSTAQSCKIITEIDVQILTSKVGFPDNQHAYVVTARKKAKERIIYFDSFKTKQKIDLKVSFQYIRVTEDEASLSAFTESSNFEWPADLLWPFTTLDDAFGPTMTKLWTL